MYRCRFMRSYPSEGQAELMFDAIVRAIGNGLDPDQMRKDTADLKAWAVGKSEDDVVAAMKGEDKRWAGVFVAACLFLFGREREGGGGSLLSVYSNNINSFCCRSYTTVFYL